MYQIRDFIFFNTKTILFTLEAIFYIPNIKKMKSVEQIQKICP